MGHGPEPRDDAARSGVEDRDVAGGGGEDAPGAEHGDADVRDDHRGEDEADGDHHHLTDRHHRRVGKDATSLVLTATPHEGFRPVLLVPLAHGVILAQAVPRTPCPRVLIRWRQTWCRRRSPSSGRRSGQRRTARPGPRGRQGRSGSRASSRAPGRSRPPPDRRRRPRWRPR